MQRVGTTNCINYYRADIPLKPHKSFFEVE
jgi:hypothetical protein